MPEQLPDETAVQLVFIVWQLPCLSTSWSIAIKDTKINVTTCHNQRMCFNYNEWCTCFVCKIIKILAQLMENWLLEPWHGQHWEPQRGRSGQRIRISPTARICKGLYGMKLWNIVTLFVWTVFAWKQNWLLILMCLVCVLSTRVIQLGLIFSVENRSCWEEPGGMVWGSRRCCPIYNSQSHCNHRNLRNLHSQPALLPRRWRLPRTCRSGERLHARCCTRMGKPSLSPGEVPVSEAVEVSMPWR